MCLSVKVWGQAQTMHQDMMPVVADLAQAASLAAVSLSLHASWSRAPKVWLPLGQLRYHWYFLQAKQQYVSLLSRNLGQFSYSCFSWQDYIGQLPPTSRHVAPGFTNHVNTASFGGLPADNSFSVGSGIFRSIKTFKAHCPAVATGAPPARQLSLSPTVSWSRCRRSHVWPTKGPAHCASYSSSVSPNPSTALSPPFKVPLQDCPVVADVFFMSPDCPGQHAKSHLHVVPNFLHVDKSGHASNQVRLEAQLPEDVTLFSVPWWSY